VVGSDLPFRVSDFTMISGPSLNNFSANAPTTQQPFSGVGARHELRVDYEVSRNITIGPSFDVSQSFYATTNPVLVFGDPSMRLAIDNVNRAHLANTDIKGAVWLQVYAPVSNYSRLMNEYTGISAAYIPTLHFRGSRFGLAGVASAKANFMKTQSGSGAMIAPLQFIAGFDGNYRVTPSTMVFLMDHFGTNCGPQESLPSQFVTPDNPRMKAMIARKQTQPLVTDGVMAGASFQVTRSVGLSPRIDWSVNQPFNTTTVGVNASFHII
jgi:hypothetical protein